MDFALSGVQWGQTMLLGLARAVSAFLVWFIVLFFVFDTTMEAIGVVGVFLLFMPLYYFMFRGMALLIGAFLPWGRTLFAAIPVIFSVAICVGDPIIYFVNRAQPSVFNVDAKDFKIVNFAAFILIYGPDEE